MGNLSDGCWCVMCQRMAQLSPEQGVPLWVWHPFDSTLTCIADYIEKLNEVLRLTRITSRTVGHLCSQRVQSYVDPSSTNSGTIHQDRFRKSVADHYGYEDATGTPQICMLTGCKHDWHDLVAGHIVPRSQASNARVDVKLPNIDDPRNGIFWSRAVEGAWSAGIFCFSFPGRSLQAPTI